MFTRLLVLSATLNLVMLATISYKIKGDQFLKLALLGFDLRIYLQNLVAKGWRNNLQLCQLQRRHRPPKYNLRPGQTCSASRGLISSVQSNVQILSSRKILQPVASPQALKIHRPSFRTQMRKHVPVTTSLDSQYPQLGARLSLIISRPQRFRCLQVKAQVVVLRMTMELQQEECLPSTNSSQLSNKYLATLVLILKP